MSQINMKNAIAKVLGALIVTAALLLTPAAYAAAPGITGPEFWLTAEPAHISQPDGSFIYSWGYGCDPAHAPAGYQPANITETFCNSMQIPGPTLIVTQGQTVTVHLKNNLPKAAGNTSILFPGFNVGTDSVDPGVSGLLAQEAAPGGTITYKFTADTPGTRAYYSGSQGDLQVEMGLYGAIIVMPSTIPAECSTTGDGIHAKNVQAQGAHGELDFRLPNASGDKGAAYNHPRACYDREYLFQFSEIDPKVHRHAEEQKDRACTGCMNVPTEPYHPTYFMINGRSMPDLMDANYAYMYPHQPYNGDPHMHPGELTLLRIIGQGRWQHPFHEHGNHVRVLARDGNLILASTAANEQNLAGPLLFTTTTTPGQAIDGIYYWTGKGLNWDAFGHNPASTNALAKPACVADANGYYTSDPTAPNYFEWCQDHNKPLQATPLGDVAAGGPATLPDPNLFANGAWFGGSPYLGPNATTRAVGFTGTTPPSGTIANPPTEEAGFAFMWHSHNEREITTNNVFPGGMMMMMLVDSREFVIDETR
jgi:FtsP/CotA-like multicopper oxidase with cupredoxin domain